MRDETSARGPSVLWVSLKSVNKYNTRASIKCIRQSLNQKNFMSM